MGLFSGRVLLLQATTGGLLQGLSDDALAVQQSISDKVCVSDTGWRSDTADVSNSLRTSIATAAACLRQSLNGLEQGHNAQGSLLCAIVANGVNLLVDLRLSDMQVGTFLQHTATFVVGFVIAFTRSWDMTLVMVGCLPFLAAVGGILAKLTTTLTNKATAAYTEVRCQACLLWIRSHDILSTSQQPSAFTSLRCNGQPHLTSPAALLLSPPGWCCGSAELEPNPHRGSLQWRGGSRQVL